MLDRTRDRLKDQAWSFRPDANGNFTHDQAMLAALMDIRDELKSLNSLLRCPNFMEIPHLLRGIKRNTSKPKRVKV